MSKSHRLYQQLLSQTHTHNPAGRHTASLLEPHRFAWLISCRPELKGDSCFLRQLSQQLLTVIAVHLHNPRPPSSNRPVFISHHRNKQVTHERGRGQVMQKLLPDCLCLFSCFISAVTFPPKDSENGQTDHISVEAEDVVELANVGFPGREVQWACVERSVTRCRKRIENRKCNDGSSLTVYMIHMYYARKWSLVPPLNHHI